MSNTNKPQSSGIRYTDAQKKEIVDFVVGYNKANIRGGQALAVKKYKVSPITIAGWLKVYGVPVVASKAAPRESAKKESSPSDATPAAAKPAVKPAAKPAVKAAAKPAVKAAAKPAVKAANQVGVVDKSKLGLRYPNEKKQEVVDFVNSYNKAYGRGGQSRAAKKYSLSVITVSSWLKAAASKKKSKGAKPVTAQVNKSVKSSQTANSAKASALGREHSELEALKAAIRALIG